MEFKNCLEEVKRVSFRKMDENDHIEQPIQNDHTSRKAAQHPQNSVNNNKNQNTDYQDYVERAEALTICSFYPGRGAVGPGDNSERCVTQAGLRMIE